MQVVSNLRRWMREMAWRFDQTKLSVDSDGHGGSPYTEIPDFHFETSLEQISILTHTTATKLFNLIHAKDAANIEVKWRIEFAVSDIDGDEVIDFFRDRSATLYLDAAALYNRMSQQVGWSTEPYFDRYKVMMKEEIRRREEN